MLFTSWAVMGRPEARLINKIKMSNIKSQLVKFDTRNENRKGWEYQKKIGKEAGSTIKERDRK